MAGSTQMDNSLCRGFSNQYAQIFQEDFYWLSTGGVIDSIGGD
jgi:hypothetical protein